MCVIADITYVFIVKDLWRAIFPSIIVMVTDGKLKCKFQQGSISEYFSSYMYMYFETAFLKLIEKNEIIMTRSLIIFEELF